MKDEKKKDSKEREGEVQSCTNRAGARAGEGALRCSGKRVGLKKGRRGKQCQESCSVTLAAGGRCEGV